MLAQHDNADTPTRHLRPLLDTLASNPETTKYYLGLLRPLRRYDNEHHGDLVKTLAAYIRHGGNSTQTSAALFLHRNSLRYRLARIQALTGLDLDDPDVRLALQVAVLLPPDPADTPQGDP